MNKIIVLLCAVFAVVKGDIQTTQHDQSLDQHYQSLDQHDETTLHETIGSPPVAIEHYPRIENPGSIIEHESEPYHNDSEYRTDDYLKLNRLQFYRILQKYDTTISQFEENYLGSAYEINTNINMVAKSIVHFEEALTLLEFLGGLRKHCVANYRSSLLNASYVSTAITSCINEAINQLPNISSSFISTRNALEDYLNHKFEKYIENCGHSYSRTVSNYIHCITNVVDDANEFAIANQKTFETQLDVAKCAAKVNIKTASECSYSVESKAISQIAEVNMLISKCIEGEPKCKPCDTCEHQQEISSTSPMIDNPFHGDENQKSCVLMKRPINIIPINY